MSHNLGKPVARGGTADIYDWEPGSILKLFHDGFGRGAVEYEARIARAVQASGLPVPAVGEIVQVGEYYGLVYQRVEGVSMTRMILRRPWRLDRYARRMAELHVDMHAAPFQSDLPTQRERLVYKITHAEALPERLRARALAALGMLPDGDRLCHGDFHPENILINPQGEIIIDWVDATLGSPLADVARTTVLLRGIAETNQAGNPFGKALARRFLAVYQRRYFRLSPGGEALCRALLPVIAAARLSENIPWLDKWLITQAETIPAL